MPGGVTARAAQVLLLSFVLGFTLPVVAAAAALFAGADTAIADQQDAARTALAGYLLALTCAVAATVLGMRTARRPPLNLTARDLGLRAGGVSGRRCVLAVVMYVAALTPAITVVFGCLEWFGVSDSGADSGLEPGPGVTPVELFHASIAGLVEEPILLALVFALGRRARWPWLLTLAVMVALRISFHIYYGWYCLFVLPWIAAAFLLYRWCPVLWPFVLAHGLFDVLQTVQTYLPGPAATVASAVLQAVAVTGVVVATGLAVRWVRVRNRRPERPVAGRRRDLHPLRRDRLCPVRLGRFR